MLVKSISKGDKWLEKPKTKVAEARIVLRTDGI